MEEKRPTPESDLKTSIGMEPPQSVVDNNGGCQLFAPNPRSSSGDAKWAGTKFGKVRWRKLNVLASLV